MVKFAKPTKFGIIDTCPRRSVVQHNPQDQINDPDKNIVCLYGSKKIELILGEKRIKYQDSQDSLDIKLGSGDFRSFSYHYLKELGIEDEALREAVKKGFSGEFFYHQTDCYTLMSKVKSPFQS